MGDPATGLVSCSLAGVEQSQCYTEGDLFHQLLVRASVLEENAQSRDLPLGRMGPGQLAQAAPRRKGVFQATINRPLKDGVSRDPWLDESGVEEPATGSRQEDVRDLFFDGGSCFFPGEGGPNQLCQECSGSSGRPGPEQPEEAGTPSAGPEGKCPGQERPGAHGEESV